MELFHGYTYSGHPLAVAAGLATLDIYKDEGLFERARALEPKFADAMMSLKGLPNVVDIRPIGLMCGIDLEPVAGQARACAATTPSNACTTITISTAASLPTRWSWRRR